MTSRAIVIAAALAAGCGHPSQQQTDLETERTLFAQAAPASYSVYWIKQCNACDADAARPVRFTVSDGVIGDANYGDGHGESVSDSVRHDLLTIDGVFDLIADRLDDDRVTVSYDRDLHYPSSLYISRYQTAQSPDDMNLFLSVDATQPPPPDPGKATLRAEMEAQRAQFVEPASYSFTFVPSCFCPPEYSGRIRISVNDGSITARYADSGQPVPESVRMMLATMGGAYDDLARRLAEGSPTRSTQIWITYDPVLHYPSDIRVTGSFSDSSAEDRRFDFVTPADAP